jgi:endonuclease YncB( thermonuclease family)
MNFKRQFLTLLIAAVLCGGCRATPTPTQAPTFSWDENMNKTARAVVAATFFAPTHTLTPTITPTITLTPSPTQTVPILTPTPIVAACIPAESQPQVGRVTQVIDGETIMVEIDGREYRVRYIGIDSPADAKSKELIGDTATSLNHDLVQGQTVRLFKDTTEADIFGRLPRYVFAGNIFVNYEIVRLGLATALADPPDTACFNALHSAEHEANVKRAGLWSRQAPTKTPLGYGREFMHDVPCDCYGEELDCKDFDTQMHAQGCYAYCMSLGLGDLFDLAVGSHGKACTGLP